MDGSGIRDCHKRNNKSECLDPSGKIHLIYSMTSITLAVAWAGKYHFQKYKILVYWLCMSTSSTGTMCAEVIVWSRKSCGDLFVMWKLNIFIAATDAFAWFIISNLMKVPSASEPSKGQAWWGGNSMKQAWGLSFSAFLVYPAPFIEAVCACYLWHHIFRLLFNLPPFYICRSSLSKDKAKPHLNAFMVFFSSFLKVGFFFKL